MPGFAMQRQKVHYLLQLTAGAANSASWKPLTCGDGASEEMHDKRKKMYAIKWQCRGRARSSGDVARIEVQDLLLEDHLQA